MVDKRSLRSSKKETQETPAEDEKPKPTRTRSARSRKPASAKSQETSTSGTDDQAPPSIQSEDVAMEMESVVADDKKANEDVEMKNVEALEEVKEDPTASPLAGTHPLP